MDKLLQGDDAEVVWSLLSEKEQKIVGDDVRSALEWELKYRNRMILGFFRGLDDYIVHPRYIDYIVQYQLARDPEFQLALEAKLGVILQSSTILSDDGWDLQNFLIILTTYEGVFLDVNLPSATIDVLRNRIEFLRLNWQSDTIIDKLSQFLPKH